VKGGRTSIRETGILLMRSILDMLPVTLCLFVTAAAEAQLPVPGAAYHFDATTIDPLNLNEVRMDGADIRVHTWLDLTGNLDQIGMDDFVSHPEEDRHPLYMPSARLTTGANSVDLPALVFDGNDRLLSPTGITGLDGAGGVTLFAVGRQTGTISGPTNGVLQAFDGNRKLAIQVEPEDGTADPSDIRFNYRVTGNNPQIRHAVSEEIGAGWVQHAIHYDGTVPLASVFFNGRGAPSATSGAVAADIGSVGTLVVGALDNGGLNGWTGEIGEIIAYPTALNATDLQAVRDYLSTKWDIGPPEIIGPRLHSGQLGAYSVVPERPEYDFLDLSFGKVNYNNPGPAHAPGKTNILLIYPFDKPRDPLPPIATALQRIDAIMAQQNLDELYGVSLGEERGFWAEYDYLSQLYDHVKANWPELKVFQWLSRPLTPPATLRADGYIYDHYTTDAADWQNKMQAHLDTGKELIPVLWASPPFAGFGSPPEVWLDASRQQAIWAQDHDLPIMLFAVSEPGPSFNSWITDPLAEPWRSWVMDELVPMPDPILPGDYNDSGDVELGDLNLVLFNWNVDESVLTTDWVNQRPTTGTAVGLPELNGVLFNWGNSASVATVPDPASEMLAVLGLLSLGIRRRRIIGPNVHPPQLPSSLCSPAGLRMQRSRLASTGDNHDFTDHD
jgi:hypothetical protein